MINNILTQERFHNTMTTDIAIIDSQISGISGDMLLSSLVDLGADKHKVINAIFTCQDFIEGSKITSAKFTKRSDSGFNATSFELRCTGKNKNQKGMDMYRSLASCCSSLDLEQRAISFAVESFKTIISAEAAVHGVDIGNVRLQETSGVDTLADLIGCAIALQDLQLFGYRIFSTKVAVGGGTLRFSHGTIPNPGDAILQIFKDKRFTLTSGQVAEEVTTPTGAAMLVNLTSESTNFYPDFSPKRLGHGLGQRKFKGIPNMLRVVTGQTYLINDVSTDSVYVIETNVDDMSGEIIGNLIERLVEAKVKDVTALPGITKKNRPNYLIRVVCDHTQLNVVSAILFSESGTLGIRFQEQKRFVLSRSIVHIPIRISDHDFNIRVKIGRDSGGEVVSIKSEYEDVKSISYKVKIPFRRAMELINAEIVDKLGSI